MTEKTKRWITLGNIMLMTTMNTLDSSIVNVALPIMADELHTNMSGIEWVVSSYTIAICATILIFGKLGDSFGKAKIFKTGIVLFTLGSFFCAISSNLPFLVLSRVFQGVGASASMATNQGLITETAPREQRGKALGLGGTFAALGTLAGPTLGGLIVAYFPWNFIFLINLPVGLIAYLLSISFLPPSQARKKEKLDGKGALMLMASLVLFFYSITLGQSKSYTNPFIGGSLLVGLLLIAFFVFYEMRKENPILQMRIFQNRLLSLSLFCSTLSFIAGGAVNFILPFYLERALKLPASNAGLLLTVFPLVLAFMGPISGAVSDRLGSERITFVGLVVSAVGYTLLFFLTAQIHTPFIIFSFAVISFGNALFQSPNTSLIMSSVERRQLGIAGSLNAFARNFGLTMGVAMGASLLYLFMSMKVGYAVNGYMDGRDDVFLFGMHGVFLCMAIILLVGAALTFFRMYQMRKNKK